MTAQHRTFETGATRDTAEGKFDYDGFLSPYVIEAFGCYMNFNRQMADGSQRDSDNWQKGIPTTAYMKSGWRHFFDWWAEHRGIPTKEGILWAMLGVLFNLQGYLHEYLKANPYALENALADAEHRRNLARAKLNKPCMTARTAKVARSLEAMMLDGDPGSSLPQSGSFG
jgi:hypothetical protein